MDKLIGYTEINVNGEVIPVKMGLYALEIFCKQLGIKFNELGSLFEADENGLPMPKDLIPFLVTAVWAGANYAAKKEGRDPYPIIDVYEWIEDIGIATPECIKIVGEVYSSILNGGTLPKEIDTKESETSVKKKNLTSEA